MFTANGIPRGFRPAFHDVGHTRGRDGMDELQPDLIADFIGTLTDHAIYDHGAVKRGSNLPPMQNFEALGVQSKVNDSRAIADLARGGTSA